MLKLETGHSTQETQKCASRTGLNSFQRAIFGRALVLQAILRDGLKKPHPEGRTERPVVNKGDNKFRESVQLHALSKRELLGLGGDGSNGRHDRLLSLLKARATSALDYLEQKLIYITDRHPCQDLLHYNR